MGANDRYFGVNAAGWAVYGGRSTAELARARRFAESREEFPELPHDAVLAITPKIRQQAKNFLAYRKAKVFMIETE